MRTVTVTGHGSARVVPDAALVRVAVVRRAAGVADAYEDLTRRAEELVVVARRHTEPHRVASTGISVWPAHDPHGIRAGFEARHGFAVACADLVAAGALLNELAQTIGDDLQVDQVGLEVTDARSAEEDARTGAVEDARARAEQLAAIAGDRLGGVQTIVEGVQHGQAPRGMEFKLAADGNGALQAGESTVTASVTITWELVELSH